MMAATIDAFIEAGIEILRTTTGMDVRRGIPRLAGGQDRPPAVCVISQIAGDLNGHVMYGASMPSALGIAGHMMGSTSPENLDDLSKSALAELGNMITGHAVSRLGRLGIHVQIFPTVVIDAHSPTTAWPLPNHAVVVPLHTDAGDLMVWVCLGSLSP